MTTPSYKVLVRVLPVAGFLVVALAVALLSAPDTFRYRGWPKPVRSAPLQSLVGLAPQLDARDPIGVAHSRQVTIGAASGARGATASPGLTTGVTGHAALRSRTVGQTSRNRSWARPLQTIRWSVSRLIRRRNSAWVSGRSIAFCIRITIG